MNWLGHRRRGTSITEKIGPYVAGELGKLLPREQRSGFATHHGACVLGHPYSKPCALLPGRNGQRSSSKSHVACDGHLMTSFARSQASWWSGGSPRSGRCRADIALRSQVDRFGEVGHWLVLPYRLTSEDVGEQRPILDTAAKTAYLSAAGCGQDWPDLLCSLRMPLPRRGQD